MSSRPRIEPQPGFQEAFLSTRADVAIGGAAAGVGKSFALVIDPLRFAQKSDASAVFFRRTYPEITNPGGLYDTAASVYTLPSINARSVDVNWRFPSGFSVVMSHLQLDRDVYKWQGAQIPIICFDELTHFSATQFWYMLSRNRNPNDNGIRPYMRATCNPDPDSFVADLVEWWIDQDEKLPDGSPNPRYGFPIPDRAGKLRYFTRDNDVLIWGDTAAEVMAKAPHLYEGQLADVRPKSLTFIPGDIHDNKILLRNDPGYLANLMALPEAEQQKLLRGNWKVRTDGLALYDPAAVGDLFTNYIPPNPLACITGDIAGFGFDWTVIYYWLGWEIVGCDILTTNDARGAVDCIEKGRTRYRIQAHNVLLDQNGVGGNVLKLRPDYRGFLNNAAPLPDPELNRNGQRRPENYFNLKTQCFYRNAERVNAGALKISLTDDNVTVDGVRGCRVKLGGKVVDVRELIKQDLRAIRIRESSTSGKIRINEKSEQKVILGGRSPDMGDPVMMRELFELNGPRRSFGGPSSE